ncbi:hypothetical protein [Paenibacillus soyae]|uniref:Uncharacterized protein n=1 Tax=Paenibacillus soyae TaxID=2969249 RepID=A0A9X2S9R5_9BACL|nr:hypothetical protein [Paenibacillus soyae]MCR2805325.1 hypothetical protein [Paenibacillus soyae]
MKRIALIHGPYDDTGDGSGVEYVIEHGRLVDGYHAMYVSRRGELFVAPVRKVDGKETLYVLQHETVQLASDVTHGDAVIDEVYADLTAMTAWQFVTQVLMYADVHVELEVAKK